MAQIYLMGKKMTGFLFKNEGSRDSRFVNHSRRLSPSWEKDPLTSRELCFEKGEEAA